MREKREGLRLLCAVLAFLLLCPALAAAAAADDDPIPVTEIRDAAGLAAMAEDPAGRYALGCDVDMTGADWTPFAFSGELDGRGHAVLNLRVSRCGEGTARTVDGNNKVYAAETAGMFSRLEGAKIHDLVLLGVSVDVESGGDCFAGALAGWMKDASLVNLRAETRVKLTQGGIMSGVGGLVGYGCGEIRNCRITTELIFLDANPKRNCEEFAGGLVGCGHPSLLDNTVEWAELWTTVHGYCHNGCLIGMHRVDVSGKVYTTVTGNTVSGRIHFLEDVASRRAYAEAVIGEKLNPRATVKNNTVVSFESLESRDPKAPVLPCEHDEAAYEAAVTPPGCTEYGYTVHTCPVCGYAFRDAYTVPGHTPGEWEVAVEPGTDRPGLERRSCAVCGEVLAERELAPHVPGGWEILEEATESKSGLRVRRCTDCGRILEEEVIAPHVPGSWTVEREADFDGDGLRVRRCTDCGEILEQEILPRLIPARSCFLDPGSLALHYKESAVLAAEVRPKDATDAGLVWRSEDESVATVSQEGVVTATGRGRTEIVCASHDGQAESRCAVTVGYTWWQWIIVILLFGWIWY